MSKFVLDTSSWMDITKSKFFPIFEELEKQVHEGKIILLTNEIIISEWERNKHKALKDISDGIKDQAKCALQIGKYLDDAESKKLFDVLQKYRDKEDERLVIAEENLERIDTLIKSAESVEIKDELKLFVLNRALTTKAPFHNKKNNIADALIYFSSVKHMDLEYHIATDLFFISSNHREFSSPVDTSKLHPDLKIEGSHTTVYYMDNLAKALQLEAEVVDELDEYHEYQLLCMIESEIDALRGK